MGRIDEIPGYLIRQMPELGDRQALNAILEISQIKEIPANTVILQEGQYIKVIPVVIKGLIKVYLEKDDRDFLLYYIDPGKSCVLSFSAGMKDKKSRVFAKTLDQTLALLIPVFKLKQIIRKFPSILKWYTDLYFDRYNELIDTFENVIFKKLDQRIYEYLKNKMQIQNKNPIKITHQEIATDLSTAREVVTRILKKLELEKKIINLKGQIKIL